VGGWGGSRPEGDCDAQEGRRITDPMFGVMRRKNNTGDAREGERQDRRGGLKEVGSICSLVAGRSQQLASKEKTSKAVSLRIN